MPFTPEPDDPFGSERLPSLSWRDVPVGGEFTVEILEPAQQVQSRDFDTNAPAFWDVEQQRPKYSAVLHVLVLEGPHSVGETRSIWAKKPSNLFTALQRAQKQAEATFGPGGTLKVRYVGAKPHENKRFSPIKQYEAAYTPLTGAGPADPGRGAPGSPPAGAADEGVAI